MVAIKTKVRIVVFNEQIDRVDDVEVLFDGATLKLDQEYEPGEHAIYTGKMVGEGHFRLATPDGDTGTLHRFPGDNSFEGWWRDTDGYEGYWRVGPVSGLGSGS